MGGRAASKRRSPVGLQVCLTATQELWEDPKNGAPNSGL